MLYHFLRMVLLELNREKNGDNSKGEIVVSPQFDTARDFEENGLAVVEVDDKYGIIDKTGKYIVNPQYDDMSVSSKEGYYIVMQEKKFGVIDKKGNIIISITYDGISTAIDKVEDSDYCSTHKPSSSSSSSSSYKKYC